MMFRVIASCMKWYQISMCFVHAWNWLFLATAMADWLSQYKSIGLDRGCSTSARNIHIHIISLVAWVIATYSNLVMDSEIIACFLEFQDTAPPSTQNV